MKTVDLLVIGGGSAGMAAALQARKEGIQDILILEKDPHLGGILNQCIHNGFGLTEFKCELTGPEYLSRFEEQVKQEKIEYYLNTFVTKIDKEKNVTFSNAELGSVTLHAKAIIISTGCYERNAGAIRLPGDRVSGVITAGTAQKYLNIHGYLCGKRIVILGSGDIGLIMARRLTLEGAKVLCVSEIMPYSNGLNRNISQCLNDFNIPLYLSHTVSNVIGENGRIKKVVLSEVDEKMNFIPNTEMEFECDTLILSVGLIPYISLLKDVNVELSRTKGPTVDEYMQTSVEGIFACGNSLHVHDVVDFVTEEGRLAGHGAALYLKNEIPSKNFVNTECGNMVGYIVPSRISLDTEEDVSLKFRIKKPIKDVNIIVESNNEVLVKQYKVAMVPSEMAIVTLRKDKIKLIKDKLIIRLEERNG